MRVWNAKWTTLMSGINVLFCFFAGQKCYKCNRVGHLARDCQESEERCYRCNDVGHKSRDCTREKDQISCYNCKEVGHLVRDCPTKVDVCFACNLEGHISRKSPPCFLHTTPLFLPHTHLYLHWKKRDARSFYISLSFSLSFSNFAIYSGNCPTGQKKTSQRQ